MATFLVFTVRNAATLRHSAVTVIQQNPITMASLQFVMPTFWAVPTLCRLVSGRCPIQCY